MMLFLKWLLFIFLSNYYCFSSALLNLDYILLTDKNTVETTTSSASTKSLYSFNLGFSIDNKKSFYFGWGLYSVITKSELSQQEANYTTQDMGPYFRYEFGRSQLVYAALTYGIQTKTAFNTGSADEDWLGTNYLLQVGVKPEISDSFTANFSLNYFTGSAKKKVVSSFESDVSYTKTFMCPSIGLAYKW